MSSCKHPNVINYYVSFVDESDLWLVMPILEAGSLEDILRLRYQNGIKDEAMIATILREILKGLQYFHECGQIHRDIKAQNILVGLDGNLHLSDFGVSARVNTGQKRQTFVGSPCWMAPEVMEQTAQGYDNKADIWSLGITAIELTQGEAPNSELPAMRVLLVILKYEPPTLNKYETIWSQEFKDFVDSCLQKDPTKRLSCNELLEKHKKFFAQAKDNNYVRDVLLKDLPNIDQRVSTVLQSQAKEYYDKIEKRNNQRNKKSAVKWDFTGSSGGQDELVK